MARARNIKPSIMANDELADLPYQDRLVFIYMWMLADRQGRMADKPRKIKAQALPYDDADCDESLQRLHQSGFIYRYEVSGEKYVQVVNFSKHQNPHKKEKDSEIPSPENEDRDEHHTSTVQEQDLHNNDPADSGLRIVDPGSLTPDPYPPKEMNGGSSTTTHACAREDWDDDMNIF